MKAILRSINNFSCKLKQSNNLKYNISPKIRNNKFKSISGNGNVVIEDSIGKNTKDYKIYGNTYQNTTSGKNLLDYINNFKTSVYGLTFSQNEEGYITASGILTTNYARCIPIYDITDLLEDGASYTLSSSNPQNNLFVEVRAKKLSDGKVNANYGTNSSWPNGRTFSVNKSSYKYDISVLTGSVSAWGTEERTVTARFQLEKNSSKTEFEPYTGGQPSPNPDYPQEIVSCGNRAKNLCFTDFNNWESGQYEINGNKGIMNARIRLKELLKVETGKTYYFDTFSEFEFVIRIYDENKNFISSIGAVENKRALTMKTAKYLGITIFNPNNSKLNYDDYEALFENKTIEPFICLNSEVDKSYEPYRYKIPVNVRSDNLFDKDNVSVGYINPSGGLNPAYSEYKTSNYIKIKPNTVYYKTDSGSTRFKYFDENFNVISDKQSDLDNATSKQSFETPANVRFLRITVHDNYLNTFQIVEGSTTPDKYIPYYNKTTNIYLDEPLRKIGDYSDYIDFVNGKVVRNIEEYTLIGDEQIKMIREGMNCVKIDGKNIRTESHTMPPIFCNMLLANSRNSIYQGNVGIGYGAINNEYYNDIVMRVPNITTLTDFTTWLQSNNVTVDYVLATPTEEDIELPNIKLIEGKNIITIGTDVQGVFETEYYSKEIIDISNYKYNLRKVED